MELVIELPVVFLVPVQKDIRVIDARILPLMFVIRIRVRTLEVVKEELIAIIAIAPLIGKGESVKILKVCTNNNY